MRNNFNRSLDWRQAAVFVGQPKNWLTHNQWSSETNEGFWAKWSSETKKGFWASVLTFLAPLALTLPKLFLTMSPQELWVCPHTDTRAWNTFKVRCPGVQLSPAAWRISSSSHCKLQLIDFHSFPPQPTVSGTTSCVAACCLGDIVVCCSGRSSPALPALSPRVSSCYLLPQFCPKWKSEDSCWSDWFRLLRKNIKSNDWDTREWFNKAVTGFTWTMVWLLW